MRRSWREVVCAVSILAAAQHIEADAQAGSQRKCSTIEFSGAVKSGETFRRQFSHDWVFVLEPERSGWFLRVLAAGAPRSDHDAAEIATPPYRSMTPLAISTDFSFRAQDAIAWNPRRFRYAATPVEFAKMVALYPAMLRNDAAASAKLAELAAQQPEATLTLTGAELVPGTADQSALAATVASHLDQVPHSIAAGPGSALGKVTALRFVVQMTLPRDAKAMPGIATRQIPCNEEQPQQTASHRRY